MGCSCRMWRQNRKICDGHHRQRLNTLLCMEGDLEPRGPSMMTNGIIVVVAFVFAMTLGLLTAKIAESGNDRASSPTISTLPLQY
jgi:hypothetical protein